MKKVLILLAMLTATISVRAQYEEGDILIQPRVGITISNITDGDKSKLNVTYGVEFERFFTISSVSPLACCLRIRDGKKRYIS